MLRLATHELVDLMEASFKRSADELLAEVDRRREANNRAVRAQADEVEASLSAADMSAALTVSRLECKSLQHQRSRMIYAIVTTIALLIGVLVERIVGAGPREVARETAAEVVDERERGRLENIDAMIRALEAERDTTLPAD